MTTGPSIHCLLAVAFGLPLAPAVSAQASLPRTLKFEVASFRPSPPGARASEIRPAPGGERYEGSNITLKQLIVVAYGVKAEQITGGLPWIDTDRYDMNAKSEKASSREELHVMLQNLLAERFNLRFHRETKNLPVYALLTSQGNPKLTRHDPQHGGDPWIEAVQKPFLHMTWTATSVSMEYFAWRLSQHLDRPVVNLTNLKGGYDFTLTFTMPLPPTISPDALMNGAPIDTSGPPIFAAVRRQLNMKLEPQKRPVEILAIDHAEKPTEN